jgi:hypothetical protein
LATISTPQDHIGKVGPVTFHPDFTAENHRFVHPTYVQLGIILKSKHLLLQKMSGQKPDQFALVNNRELLERVIAVWSQFDGLTIPVQGQDWWYTSYHNLIFVHGVLRVFLNSPEAAYLQEQLLEVSEKLQNSNNRGCMLEEDGENIIVVPNNSQNASHMEYDIISNMADTYLLHLFGGTGAQPTDRGSVVERYRGVHTYPFGGIMVNRTSQSFCGFSWRNHVMAYCLPEQGLWLTTPIFNSYIGNIWMPGETIVLDEEQKVHGSLRHSLISSCDGFAAIAELQRRLNPDVRQHIAFISLPDGRAVYTEQFTGNPGTYLQAIHTGVVGVRNEKYRELPEYASGHRTLTWQAGEGMSSEVFEGFLGEKANLTRDLPVTAYVNIDEQIGYVLLGSKGGRYYNRHQYRKWRGLEDVLILNCSEGSFIDPAGRGESFAMVVLPNRSSLQTRDEALATSYSFGKDYAIVDTGEWLVYANYGKRQAVKFTKRILADGAWIVYEGSQTLTHGESIWYGSLAGYSSGYNRALLKLESMSLANLDLEVFISGDRWVIDNRSQADAELIWTKLATGGKGTILVRSGSRMVVGE